MQDVLCPNCSKDNFEIIVINGVKVKRCKTCSAIYQLAEKEICADYLLDSKDIDGKFIKCPKCGSDQFKRSVEVSIYDFPLSKLLLHGTRAPHYKVTPNTYVCLNPKCFFVWETPLF